MIVQGYWEQLSACRLVFTAKSFIRYQRIYLESGCNLCTKRCSELLRAVIKFEKGVYAHYSSHRCLHSAYSTRLDVVVEVSHCSVQEDTNIVQTVLLPSGIPLPRQHLSTPICSQFSARIYCHLPSSPVLIINIHVSRFNFGCPTYAATSSLRELNFPSARSHSSHEL